MGWFLGSSDYNDHRDNLRSEWCAVMTLLAMLLFKHVADAVSLARNPEHLPAERRQLLRPQQVLQGAMNWADRFTRAANLTRTAFLMLLGVAFFSSLPVQHDCPARIPPPFFSKGAKGHSIYLRAFQGFERPVIPLPPPSSPYPEPPFGPSPRPPTEEPPPPTKPPVGQPPRQRPPIGGTPPGGVPPRQGSHRCYSNAARESVSVIAWVYTSLVALWIILEMTMTDFKSNSLTSAVMGTLAYPLVIAMFSIVFDYWNSVVQ